MSQRRRIGAVLLAAVREDAGTTRRLIQAKIDPQRLAIAARYHGAVGYLHAALEGSDSDPAVLDAIATTYHYTVGISMRTLADLSGVAAALDGGVPWLVVKGPVVAERLYPDPGLRPYNDLDVVVPAAFFERAVGALGDAGGSMIERNWRLVRREMRGQVHLELRHGTLADVHWHLINRDRTSFAIDMEALFDRAWTVDVAGLPVRTLDSTDTLLHLCLHAYLAGANKLVWAKDISRALTVDAPDWDEAIRRARAWRAGLPVAAMLERSRRMMGAAVPGEVLHRLGSPIRRGADRIVAAAIRAERSASGRGGAAVPARLLARTPIASGLVYARRSVSRLRSRGSHPIDRVLLPVGDDQDRRAFIEGVARSTGSGKPSP